MVLNKVIRIWRRLVRTPQSPKTRNNSSSSSSSNYILAYNPHITGQNKERLTRNSSDITRSLNYRNKC